MVKALRDSSSSRAAKQALNIIESALPDDDDGFLGLN